MSVIKKQSYLPGEEGVWVFIGGDLLIFSMLFISFALDRSEAPDLFSAGRLELSLSFGAINTLILLQSSWFVVKACNALRSGLYQRAKRLFRFAWLLGLTFGLIKIIEYVEKFRSNYTLTTSDFFMYYFVMTGIHFIHVIVGLAVLAWMIKQCRPTEEVASNVKNVESGAAYWHMVDLLWVLIFPLLYMIA